jgi:hypothetical protein
MVTVSLESIDPIVREVEDSADRQAIYPALLSRFSLSEIDSAVRWLEYCGYVKERSASIRGPFFYSLTDKGLESARVGRIPDEDRRLLYQEQEPYSVFVAHQFSEDDTELVAYLRDHLLVPGGFAVLEGRAEGLEQFRDAIVQKIRKARFFICLLTGHVKLARGGLASSVWLYQETGVAVAFGKRPLLLVEDGIDSKYIGELQSVYEHIPFTRSNHPRAFDRILPRFVADLQSAGIPLPGGG